MKIMPLVDVVRGGERDKVREKLLSLPIEAAWKGGGHSGSSGSGLRLPAKFGEEEGGTDSATV
jgi:hypothetical protein